MLCQVQSTFQFENLITINYCITSAQLRKLLLWEYGGAKLTSITYMFYYVSAVCAVAGINIEIVWYAIFVDFQILKVLSSMKKWSLHVSQRSKTLLNFFKWIFRNKHDWYLRLFCLELSSNFVLLVIFVTENQSIFFHLPCNVFYIQCLSFQLHGFKSGNFTNYFFLFP